MLANSWRWILGILLLVNGFGASHAECRRSTAPLDEYTSGWGIDERNTRHQPRSRLNRASISDLTLRWVYAMASDTPRSYPLVTADTIYLGDGGRGLIALERSTGCERWVFKHEGEFSTAILPARIKAQDALVFSDRLRGVYAVNRDTGALIWHATVDEDPLAWYSGSPIIVNDRIYVPISSYEVALALNPLYGCCTTSGGIGAFDLITGEKLWYLPTISEPPEKTYTHWGFVQHYGPSGAAVWGAPAYDQASDTLFFGTGQNYSHPTTDTSDAIFAVNATSGAVKWVRQFTENDAYTAACNNLAWQHPNCPKPTGPDVDFGAATVLVHTSDGSSLLIASQKSGDIYALRPESGETVWRRKLGRGGIIGGVHWGISADEAAGLLYIPISDKELVGFPAPGTPAPGLYALDIETGEQRWHYAAESRCPEYECVFGLSAAPIATNDLVLVGSIDGYLRAVGTEDGSLQWQFDAWQKFAAVNQEPAQGGAFDTHGPIVFDDMLVISSGYSYVGQQRGGNALLVFQLDENDD